jgi:hypothetical protein
MKIPQRLKMFGYDWRVVLSDKDGGSFEWSKLTITLDKKWTEEILIHEILEMIMVNLNYRFYGQEGNMEYHFFFDHTGLCRIHRELFKILKDNNLLI